MNFNCICRIRVVINELSNVTKRLNTCNCCFTNLNVWFLNGRLQFQKIPLSTFCFRLKNVFFCSFFDWHLRGETLEHVSDPSDEFQSGDQCSFNYLWANNFELHVKLNWSPYCLIYFILIWNQCLYLMFAYPLLGLLQLILIYSEKRH